MKVVDPVRFWSVSDALHQDAAKPIVALEAGDRAVLLAAGQRDLWRIDLEQRAERFEVVATARFERLAGLMSTLDDGERAALGLDAARGAALAMLDGALAEVARDRAALEDLARCLEPLADAFAVDLAQASDAGVLGLPVAADPRALGWVALLEFLWEPLVAIGRVRQLSCLGRAPAATNHPFFDSDIEPAALRALVAGLGARPDPDLEPGSHNRALSDAALLSGAGLVHPAMVGAIAATLGRSEAEIRELAVDSDGQGGPLAILEALGERAGELLVDAIPVLAPRDRPTLRFVAEGVVTEVAHPISDAYRVLLGRLDRFDRLVSLGAPEILIWIEAAAIQRAFDRLFAAIAEPAEVTDLDGWGSQVDAAAEVELGIDADNLTEPDDDSPPTMVWLDGQTIAVARGGEVAELDLDRRSVSKRFEIGGARLQACDPSGRFVVASTESGFFDDDRLDGFGCWDREAGAWLAVLPAELPPVTFGKPDQPEDGVLYNLGRAAAIVVGRGDRPTALCWSRGNREVLESGDYGSCHNAAIRSTTSGLIVFDRAVLSADRWGLPMLGTDGTDGVDGMDGVVEEPNDELVEAVDEAMVELWEPRYLAPRPAAIARHPIDGWRLLSPELIVASADGPLFWLGLAVEAACFSPDAERLAVLVADEVIEIAIGERRIVGRHRCD